MWKVAIVNQSFAKHFFGDRSAVGRYIGRGNGPKAKLEIEIIGVVADSLYEGPREGVRRQVFVPHWGKNSTAFYVRTAMGSTATYKAVREEIKKLDERCVQKEEGRISSRRNAVTVDRIVQRRFQRACGVLAAVGLCGVMARVMTRRTRNSESCSGSATLRCLAGDKRVLILLSIGLIGVPAAIELRAVRDKQLYGIKGNNPWMAVMTVLILGLWRRFARR
jgi:hypothetical protein